MRRLTTIDFINKAIDIHGEKYDYSFVEYINNSTKVKIVCPAHGEFYQAPISHLAKNGCVNCGKTVPFTRELFITKANEVHHHKYDYSRTIYKNAKTKIKIICPLHEEFEQQPHHHLKGYGCQMCAGVKAYTNETFIEASNLVHNYKYDYSDVEYVNSHTKVAIKCRKCGYFFTRPYHHLQGGGCPYCANPKLL